VAACAAEGSVDALYAAVKRARRAREERRRAGGMKAARAKKLAV
jgi:hypothetical protein